MKTKYNKALNLIRSVSSTGWGCDQTNLMMIYISLIKSKIDYGYIHVTQRTAWFYKALSLSLTKLWESPADAPNLSQRLYPRSRKLFEILQVTENFYIELIYPSTRLNVRFSVSISRKFTRVIFRESNSKSQIPRVIFRESNSRSHHSRVIFRESHFESHISSRMSRVLDRESYP